MGLNLPTSEQMSEDIGAPAFAYHPTDYPHYDAVVSGDITEAQIEERAAQILEAWADFCPEIAQMQEVQDNIRGVAMGYTAEINGVSNDDGSHYFIVTMPSAALEMSDLFTLGTGLRGVHAEGHVPLEDHNYISVQHEIGHGVAKVRGIEFDTLYDDELFAERYALEKYLDAGGDLEVVQASINGRALDAFIAQNDEYWIAPALSNHFLGSDFDTVLDANRDVHTALRARVSESLLNGRGSADAAVEEDVLRTSDPRLVFSAVQDVVNHQGEDPRVRGLGQMVLDGAEAYMPDFLPQNYRGGPGRYTADFDAHDYDEMFI